MKQSYLRILAVAALALCATLSATRSAAAATKGVAVEPFGTTSDGKQAHLYTLTNKNGMVVKLTDFGAIVVAVRTPDRNGKLDDIALGFDDVKSYETNAPYFGITVGRYANRIGKAQFTLDGKTYKLFPNDHGNTLHGGERGFGKYMWTARELKGSNAVEFTRTSPDGEEGYPGKLDAKVVFTLTDRDELKIEYTAATDKDTVVNLTNHSYFNLAGPPEKPILDELLLLNASRFTPVDGGLIPTGELLPVKGTPMDFTTPAAIGARIGQDYEQLKLGKGYDHNWVLNGKPGEMKLAARVTDPTSGRVMEVETTEPGIQFYSGNFLDGTYTGHQGKAYNFRFALALETQHFPDSPNQPNFPSTVLKPGQTYHTETVYRFSVTK